MVSITISYSQAGGILRTYLDMSESTLFLDASSLWDGLWFFALFSLFYSSLGHQ